MPEGIQRLSRRYLRNPEFLKLSADFIGVHEIKHLYYSIPGVQRENELLRILDFEEPESAIIFCNTREETGRVAEFLRQHGHDAEAISSDLSQTDRERVMGRMRAGRHQFLVATDVAARGIDIENLSHVFNYTFPESPEIYIHRTGRTGRAGKQGDRGLADRPDRGGVVLLPEAALQDQTGRARAAVGGGDPLAPRGGARPGATRARWPRTRAPSGGRWRAG